MKAGVCSPNDLVAPAGCVAGRAVALLLVAFWGALWVASSAGFRGAILCGAGAWVTMAGSATVGSGAIGFAATGSAGSALALADFGTGLVDRGRSSDLRLPRRRRPERSG